jgi:uncharacterized membrane protein YeaQ/YmgE (transglycosylase-associated protein family)
MEILLWIVLGAVAGWIAGMVMGSSRGVIGDIILGIIGAFIGGFIMRSLGESGVTGFNIYSLVVATIGAIVLIFLGRLLRK